MKNLAITQGAAMLKALGNQKRLEILYHLSGKELNVAVLRNNGFVKTRRSAQTFFYSIRSVTALKVINLLDRLYNKPYQNGEC